MINEAEWNKLRWS